MAYVFDYTNKKIQITSPQTDVDIQTLYDEIREAEVTNTGITYPEICAASGKEDLGNSVAVGITLELLGNWQIEFYEDNYIAKISGGNLVGGIAGDPVAYTAGVQVLLIQSAASTVVVTGSGVTEQDKIDIATEVVDQGVLLEDNFLALK